MAELSRRRFLGVAAGVGAVVGVPGLRNVVRADPAAAGEWLAGDLHCHTVLSHDVWGPGDDNTGLDEAWTLGWTAGEQIAIAESRGLQFLAVTDHNRVDGLHLAEYRSDLLTLVPGYEHSLAGGHAGVFVPSTDLLPGVIVDGDGTGRFAGPDGLTRFAAAVHERHGLTVLNHPFYGNDDEGDAVAWGYPADASAAAMDAVEVWNIGWYARHDLPPPPFNIADSDNHLSLPWWEREILPRRRLAAVGGSDNHYRSTTPVQGVGQPTTWVFAADRTAAGVLAAIRAGRTTLAAQPPAFGGARLALSAVEAWRNGGAGVIGDALRAEGPLEVTIQVVNGSGNRLRLVSTGMVVGEATVVAPVSSHTFTVAVPPGGWVRAELYTDPGLTMAALTSPLYAGDRAPSWARTEPTTGPPATYAGLLPG